MSAADGDSNQARNAILKQYQRLFEYENVRMTLPQEAAAAVAPRLWPARWARADCHVLEELMLDLMYPAQQQARRDIEITSDMVEAPRSVVVPAGKSGR